MGDHLLCACCTVSLLCAVCSMGCGIGYGYLHRIPVPTGDHQTGNSVSPDTSLLINTTKDGFSEVCILSCVTFLFNYAYCEWFYGSDASHRCTTWSRHCRMSLSYWMVFVNGDG